MATAENIHMGDGAAQLVLRMGEAANAFLASLSTDQRSHTVFPFADQSARTEWHYTPHKTPGMPFTEMDRTQQRLAQRLIACGLSRAGFNLASTIMGLETALDAIEEWSAELWWRDSRLYTVTIFGTPGSTEPWSWRFQGHHISLNYTIVDGRIVAPTPSFFGSNPAEAPLGPTSWIRPLGATEDLARELVHALDSGQRAQALIAEIAPPDIVSLNRPAVVNNMMPLQSPGITDPPGVQEQYSTMERFIEELQTTPAHLEAVRYTTTPKGVAGTALNKGQRELMAALVAEYIRRMPEELAEIELARFDAAGLDQLHFVWAGPIERHAPHYFRLQGPRFLAEYDNIQNNANHVHSVWRDPSNDFGVDLLAHHYEHAHS